MNHALGTLGSVYAAFARGDIDTIIAAMADDVKWEHWQDNRAQQAGVNWLQPRQGKEGARAFFASLAPFEFPQFDILSMMTGGNKVAVEVELTVFVPTLNARVKEEEIHLWTFNDDGKISHFRHYLDTEKHIQLSRALNR